MRREWSLVVKTPIWCTESRILYTVSFLVTEVARNKVAHCQHRASYNCLHQTKSTVSWASEFTHWIKHSTVIIISFVYIYTFKKSLTEKRVGRVCFSCSQQMSSFTDIIPNTHCTFKWVLLEYKLSTNIYLHVKDMWKNANSVQICTSRLENIASAVFLLAGLRLQCAVSLVKLCKSYTSLMALYTSFMQFQRGRRPAHP